MTGIAVSEYQGDCCWILLCRDILPGEPAVLLCLTQIALQEIVIGPVNATSKDDG